jgi:methylated-DNA-[protein]-cysteine S-methyltransferase
MDYQACIPTPFAVLGIRCTTKAITSIDFLPLSTPALAPKAVLDQRLHETIQHYLQDPTQLDQFPLELTGTPFQQKVWQAIRRIPPGQTLTYAELAQQVGSGARAVANACGANPIPLFIPCHRVVAANGLGGFMKGRKSDSLNIKRWLLKHEAPQKIQVSKQDKARAKNPSAAY